MNKGESAIGQIDLPILVAVTPEKLHEVSGLGRTLAHMAYRVCQGPHLYRIGGFNPPRGGIMYLHCGDAIASGEPSKFCQEVVRECITRNFRGVVCDFELGRSAILSRVIAQLGEQFVQRGWVLFVTEQYGDASPYARVMISSALSGGSIKLRLEEAVARYGKRVTLAVERLSERFVLPSITGNGQPIGVDELQELRNRIKPSVFFSAELCARYFTYMGSEGNVYFILYDDKETIVRKMELAAQLGAVSVLMNWSEIEEFELLKP